MLEPLQKKFLSLLRQFMKPEKKEKIVIKTPDEWSELLKLSAQHHVIPMVYQSIGDLLKFEECPDAVKKDWKQYAYSQVILQTRRTSAFLELYQKMTAQGITPLIVKGLVCRELYEQPDFRISSDEDILISKEDMQKCDEFLQTQGFQREEEIRGNETSYLNRENNVFLEMHTALMPVEDSSFVGFNDEFRDVFENKKNQEINGYNIYTLEDTSHFFYLLCHSYKHFVYSGFGIRQLCDILMMAEQEGKNIDWSYIIEKTKSYHMYIFWMNLFDIGEKYLGFNWEKSGCPRLADIPVDSEALLLDMLDGGVYGSSSAGRVHSANITLSAVSNKNVNADVKVSLKSSLFPSKSYMERDYTYLKKAGWLLPVAWSHRIFRYWKKIEMMKKAGETNIDSIAVGKQRIELLKKYGIVK